MLPPLQAVRDHDLDGEPMGPGPRDVLCQHILIAACAGPFHAGDLYAQVTTAGRYAQLTRAEFDSCLEFCATGGYALKAYDRWRRLLQTADGKWQLRDPRAAQRIRMNIGTIQDSDRLKVRMRGRGGRALGEVEEAFASTLVPGDSFLIGGQVVRYEGLRDLTVEVTKQPGKRPKIATFSGTKICHIYPVEPADIGGVSTRRLARAARLYARLDRIAAPRGASCRAQIAYWWRAFPMRSALQRWSMGSPGAMRCKRLGFCSQSGWRRRDWLR